MICDTSGLFSAFSADQPHHDLSKEALAGAKIRYVSPLVLAELDHVANRHLGKRAGSRIMRELTSPAYSVTPYDVGTLRKAVAVMETYADLNIGVVDASLVIHAHELQDAEILTLDQRHFRAMRGLDGRHFKLLPFDAV